MKWFNREKRPEETKQPQALIEPEASITVADVASAPQSEVVFVEHYPYDEQKDPRVTDIEERLLNYYLPDGRDNARRAGLIENDLVMTNNFSLWINGAKPSEWNLWDYRKEPFADVFGALLRENAELIAQVNQWQEEYQRLMNGLWDNATRGIGKSAVLQAQLHTLESQIAPRMTQIFRTFAPRMLDAGYDIFNICL